MNKKCLKFNQQINEHKHYTNELRQYIRGTVGGKLGCVNCYGIKYVINIDSSIENDVGIFSYLTQRTQKRDKTVSVGNTLDTSESQRYIRGKVGGKLGCVHCYDMKYVINIDASIGNGVGIFSYLTQRTQKRDETVSVGNTLDTGELQQYIRGYTGGKLGCVHCYGMKYVINIDASIENGVDIFLYLTYRIQKRDKTAWIGNTLDTGELQQYIRGYGV